MKKTITIMLCMTLLLTQMPIEALAAANKITQYSNSANMQPSIVSDVLMNTSREADNNVLLSEEMVMVTPNPTQEPEVKLSTLQVTSVTGSTITVTNESDFIFDESTGTIVKYVGTGGDVVIPSTIGGVSVKKLGKEEVIDPDDVSANSVFYNCIGLTSITIPDSVTSIGAYAFCGCTGLTNVLIPDSVTSIGERAFSYCIGLTSITIPHSVTNIGNFAFYNCGLTTITLSESLTSIGDYVFDACTELTKIVIPDSVTSIGISAFSYCQGLTDITIPDNVTSIGDYAFSGCVGLTNIIIPNSVTNLGGYLFSGCTRLTKVLLRKRPIVRTF